MKTFVWSLGIVALLAASVVAWDHANCGRCGCAAGHCRPVVTTEPIKKVVYETRLVPYCRHYLPGFFECPNGRCCECRPQYKRVLVKREIICGERQVIKCEPVVCGQEGE